MMAVVGMGSASAVGIAGIVFLIIVFIVVIVVIIAVIRWSHKQPELSSVPEGWVEAENMNLNLPVSTVTLEGRSITSTHPYEMTPGNWIRAMQSGVVAIGTQPGYPEDPTQLYSLAAQK